MDDKPFDMLNDLLGNSVIVELKNGREIQGKLKAFDVHINLVLQDALVKNIKPETEAVTKKFPLLFVRGDMVLWLA